LEALVLSSKGIGSGCAVGNLEDEVVAVDVKIQAMFIAGPELDPVAVRASEADRNSAVSLPVAFGLLLVSSSPRGLPRASISAGRGRPIRRGDWPSSSDRACSGAPGMTAGGSASPAA